MSLNKKGLGKGLGALLQSANDDSLDSNGVLELKLNEIEPNTKQPRKKFDDEKLIQLSESIKQHGIVQPIIVNNENGVYRIVAGERRWRAARLAGVLKIPVIIKDLTDKQIMEVALVENLQREDLNSIEEAEAYEKLIKEHNMTQEQLSITIGKSRPAISNALRLLGLSEKIKEYVINSDLSSGHARALIPIESEELKLKISDEIIKNKLSVRETENLVKKCLASKPESKTKSISEEIVSIENRLQNIFGTKVKLQSNNKKGKILIEYYSNEELERIIELVTRMEK